jgi:hypothetical protein
VERAKEKRFEKRSDGGIVSNAPGIVQGADSMNQQILLMGNRQQ